MNRLRLAALATLTAALLAAAPAAEPQPKAGPLELRIVAKKDTYTLDLGGKTPAEFRKMVADLADAYKQGLDNKKPPEAPVVDLVLEIRNISDKDAVALVKGDDNLTLQLKGPGAVTLMYPVFYTQELRLAEAVKLGPGRSYTIPLKSLEGGFRRTGQRSYWTEPGEYTLTATYSTRGGGDQAMTLTSAPAKLKVVGKEK